jgi:hypothetical protein
VYIKIYVFKLLNKIIQYIYLIQGVVMTHIKIPTNTKFLYEIMDNDNETNDLAKATGKVVNNIVNDNYHHMPNVVNSVANIFRKLKQNKEVLLLADLQSGKTSAINRILELCEKSQKEINKLIGFRIDHIYIIICSTLSELRNDITQKTTMYDGMREVYGIPFISNMLNRYYNNDDTDSTKILKKMRKNSLIMFDESHADSEIDKTIARLRNAIGLSVGDNDDGVSNRLVTISATPYEQMAKEMCYIRMKPAKGYYGLIQMDDSELLKQASNLMEYKNIKDIWKCIIKKHGKNPRKYILIRLPGDIANATIVVNNVKKYFPNRIFLNYDMSSKFNLNEMLDKKPSKTTIIFVKDMIRMGITINTEHICCMHDSFKNSFAHTAVQGFAGRSCGFNKKNHKVIVYCDYDKIMEHVDWIKSGYAFEQVPDHAKNIYANGEVKTRCIYSNAA